MPYANNNGVKIYYEVEGEGPPLVLLHGGADSIETWKEHGYVAALKSEYQVILRDERAHGKSDKPHSPDSYGIQFRVGDVLAILEELDIDRAHFFGYSGGGRIALEIGKLVPGRVTSLIIGAMTPGYFGDTLGHIINVLEAGPEALVAVVEQSGSISAQRKARLLANDTEALAACMKAPLPDLEAELPNMTMPVLVFLGDADAFFPHDQLKIAYSKVRDFTFFTLPGLDDGIGQERPDTAPHQTVPGPGDKPRRQLMDIVKTEYGDISGMVMGDTLLGE